MWGYQSSYRWEIEYLMNSVMRELGVHEANCRALLVGVKIPGVDVPHPVCIEPEDGPWPLDLFSRLREAIEEKIKTHPLQNMFYGDEPSMRDKPENIRRDSVRQSAQAALIPYDEMNGVRSFAGACAPRDGYYVVPILQIPAALFENFRPLREPVNDGQFTGHPSLIHAAISAVLNEAHSGLSQPDPGRFSNWSASGAEIVRRAANSFMYTPGIAIRERGYGGRNLFEGFNNISSLMYEGVEGVGRMLLADPDGGAVDVALRFSEPVPFSKPRWARKVIQMASLETTLIASCENILGLGSISKDIDPWVTQNVFEIEFHDHFHWSLSCGSETLLVSRYGAPSLPQERFPKARLVDTFQRLFPEATEEDVSNFAGLFEVAINQPHGNMLVVACDASSEAVRLRGQGTEVIPSKLTPELYRRVSSIDGTVLMDPHGICHSIGVILDGAAQEECTPSRGARYNSGIRYVGGSSTPRLAVVVSDDKTVDVIPILRPRIARIGLDEQVAKLEAATKDNYHSAINWLDKHRFYLDQTQCDRINAALLRITNEPKDVGEIMIRWPEFIPHPGCTSEYFFPDGG